MPQTRIAKVDAGRGKSPRFKLSPRNSSKDLKKTRDSYKDSPPALHTSERPSPRTTWSSILSPDARTTHTHSQDTHTQDSQRAPSENSILQGVAVVAGSMGKSLTSLIVGGLTQSDDEGGKNQFSRRKTLSDVEWRGGVTPMSSADMRAVALGSRKEERASGEASMANDSSPGFISGGSRYIDSGRNWSRSPPRDQTLVSTSPPGGSSRLRVF